MASVAAPTRLHGHRSPTEGTGTLVTLLVQLDIIATRFMAGTVRDP
jgi:hypothetical protein